MKPIRCIAFFLAVLMCFTCLSGCGAGTAQNTPSSATASTAETAASDTAGQDTTAVDESGSTPTASGEATQASADITEPSGSVSVTSSIAGTGTQSAVVSTSTTAVTTTVTKTTATAPTTTKPPQTSTPVTLKALSSEAYYGYQYLVKKGGNLAAVYRYVAEGIAAMQTDISLTTAGFSVSEAEIATVMRCYYADYPQHFWYGGAYNYQISGSKVLSVLPVYTMTAAQKQTAQPKVDKAVKDLLGKAAYGQTEFDRELILHDELAVRVNYVSAANAHNLYGALVEGKAVCEGYARAFQYLLYQAGIPCLYVEGTSVRPGGSKGEAHAWNIVRINGSYYHTDITWNDQSSATMHAFFNLNDTFIKEDHTISANNPYSLPACTATSDSYYVKKGTEAKTFSVDDMAQRFTKGNGVATVYLTKNTVNEFLSWFQTNLSAISAKAGLSGKSFGIQHIGREVIITAK